MLSHVLPFLSDEYIDGDQVGGNDDKSTGRAYTHVDYVRGAEECLLIEDEMDRLEVEDPEYLDELEREALRDDPTMVAEIISNVLADDDVLLTNIISKLRTDVPDVVGDMEGMLSEGETLGSRPDVVALIIARLLSDEQNLDLLDDIDEALFLATGRYDSGVEDVKNDDGRTNEDDGGGLVDEL